MLPVKSASRVVAYGSSVQHRFAANAAPQSASGAPLRKQMGLAGECGRFDRDFDRPARMPAGLNTYFIISIVLVIWVLQPAMSFLAIMSLAMLISFIAMVFFSPAGIFSMSALALVMLASVQSMAVV